MHEMSVASGIMNLLRSKLTEIAPCKLIAMELLVGRLSGIDESSLRFALDTLLAERGLDSVEIRFASAPPRFKCPACCWAGSLVEFTVRCPACRKGELEITAGCDVTLERIEVE